MKRGRRLIVILAALAASGAWARQDQIARSPADWVVYDIPFIASNAAEELLGHEQMTAYAAVLQEALTDARDEFAPLLDQYRPRMKFSLGPYGQPAPGEWVRVHELRVQWRDAVDEFEERWQASVEAVLEAEALDLWNERRDRYDYGRLVDWLRLRGPGPYLEARMPHLLEVLDDAAIEYESNGRLDSDVANHLSRLAEQSRSIRSQSPRILYDSAKPESRLEVRQQEGERYERLRADFARATYEAVAAIATALPDEDRLRLESALICTKYPEFCQPTPVDIAVELLRKSDGVSEIQRQEIDRIYGEYLLRYGSARASLAAHHDAWTTPVMKKKRALAIQAYAADREHRDNPRTKHPGLPDLREMWRLQVETCKALRALFTDEEYARLSPPVHVALTWPE